MSVSLSGVGTGTEAVGALSLPEGGGDPVVFGGRTKQTTEQKHHQLSDLRKRWLQLIQEEDCDVRAGRAGKWFRGSGKCRAGIFSHLSLGIEEFIGQKQRGLWENKPWLHFFIQLDHLKLFIHTQVASLVKHQHRKTCHTLHFKGSAHAFSRQHSFAHPFIHSFTDLHVHGDRDLLLMSSLPSGTEGTSEEIIRVWQPGRRRGGSTLEEKETTHDALQHTCREKRNVPSKQHRLLKIL